MEQHVNFFIINTSDGKTQFKGDDITITVDGFLFNNGKHVMTDPGKASAHFVCGGELCVFNNTQGITTVEDWYWEELLQKWQMLKLLSSVNMVLE